MKTMSSNKYLPSIDLDEKLSKAEYKEIIPDLELRLQTLQRRAIEAGLPVVVVFEGGESTGKGDLINRVIRTLDRRHLQVHSIKKVYEREFYRPYLWRFWRRLPAAGRMSIMDRSWYGPILQKRVGNDILIREWQTACEEIEAFERQLCDGGYLIVKIFLHITQEEQEKRFLELESQPATAWKVTRGDWIDHENHDLFCEYAEQMLARSDTECAPWHLLSSTDRRAATVGVFRTIADSIEQALKRRKKGCTGSGKPKLPYPKRKADPLAKVDLGQSVEREEYSTQLDELQNEIHKQVHQIYTERQPVVVVYEGWDAAGKGGNIKRLTQSMDPRGYEVIPIAAPNEVEKQHHYLWRFWRAVPKAGHVAIFDRSWYGRVLVERVEGLCTRTEWRRAYREINEFEEQLLNAGTLLFKFWLHIDKDEQLRRFQEREKDPAKHWKITDEDWRNRERWDDYDAAVKDMLRQTSTDAAPWTVVESNSKYYARLKALRMVVEGLRGRLKTWS
jgi:polyphosphate kinase 2 (PPK2 family)